MTRTSRASPEYWRSDAEMGDHPAPREPHPGQNGRRSATAARCRPRIPRGLACPCSRSARCCPSLGSSRGRLSVLAHSPARLSSSPLRVSSALAACSSGHSQVASTQGRPRPPRAFRSRRGGALRWRAPGRGRRGSTAPATGDRSQGVEKNMGGIAVDIGQPGERDGHSQLLGDLAVTAWAADSPTSRRPPGQLPIAVIDPTDRKDLAAPCGPARTLRAARHAQGARSDPGSTREAAPQESP